MASSKGKGETTNASDTALGELEHTVTVAKYKRWREEGGGQDYRVTTIGKRKPPTERLVGQPLHHAAIGSRTSLPVPSACTPPRVVLQSEVHQPLASEHLASSTEGELGLSG